MQDKKLLAEWDLKEAKVDQLENIAAHLQDVIDELCELGEGDVMDLVWQLADVLQGGKGCTFETVLEQWKAELGPDPYEYDEGKR